MFPSLLSLYHKHLKISPDLFSNLFNFLEDDTDDDYIYTLYKYKYDDVIEK